MPPDDLIAALMFARGHDSALRALLDRIDASELEAVADVMDAEGATLVAEWLRTCAKLAREVAEPVVVPRSSHVRELGGAPHAAPTDAPPDDEAPDSSDTPTVVEGRGRRRA